MIEIEHFESDIVRKEAEDWDFTEAGRIRQAIRMNDLAQSTTGDVLLDFICPTNELRELVRYDILIWVDTLQKSIYEDTNALFEPPRDYDLWVTSKGAELWANKIVRFLERVDYVTPSH